MERRRTQQLLWWCACVVITLVPRCARASAGSEVKKLWGLADSTASVGHLFHYHLPSDAFQGDIRSYKVFESSRDSLPAWLYFDAASSTIKGIPSWRDVGQLYLTVQARGERSVAQDIFSLEVLSTKTNRLNRVALLKNVEKGGGGMVCEAEPTLLSVMLDADFHSMKAEDRVHLLHKIAKHLDLHNDAVQLTPLEFGERAFDGNTMMAGPGDARNKKHAGLVVQWQVGCKGVHLDPSREAMVGLIEKSSRDGSLAKVVGHSVIGWHLATSTLSSANGSKHKRQAQYAQPTPVPELQPTRFPAFTQTVSENFGEENEHEEGGAGSVVVDEYDEGPIPDIRIVPTMSSPSFTYATATTHRHRHQHELGTRTRGGEKAQHQHNLWPSKHYDEDGYLTASPAFRGMGAIHTPSPTPSLHLPVQPTHYPPWEVDPSEDSEPPSTLPTQTHTEPLPTTDHARVLPPSSSESTDHIAPSKSTDVPVIHSTTGTQQNFNPVMRTRIQKQVFIAGKISRFQIPAGTFFDFEDGETPNLKLVLTNVDGTSLQANSWIQFNSAKQEVYAIPLEENIGTWDFQLEAMDADEGSVKTVLEIHVRQHSTSRAVHHEFVMSLKYDKWRFASNIDWQMKLAQHLAAFFGDSGDQNIVVRSVSYDPLVFTWTNDTLPTHPCPHDLIREMLEAMVFNREGSVSKHLRKAVGPEFKVLKVTVNLLGHCKVKTATTSTTMTNRKPVVRNQIDQINATVGEFLHFRVPEDTFYDEEDGDVRNLKLIFLTIDGGVIPRSSWIQFNSATQEFIGLPMGEDLGLKTYQLVALDKEGSSANDALVITVHKRPEAKTPSVEFSIRIDYDYHTFNNDLTKKVMVLDKLAHLYGDPDPRFVVVRSINHGSVVFTWTNSTLPAEPCPKEQVGQLVKIMFNNNGTVSRKLLDTFKPEFNITGADVIPYGLCLADITPTSISVGPTATSGTEHAVGNEDFYITTIIPAAVIAAMLLIAAIIACILYRKKRKGKMSMEDSSTFVNKGIPIIFADELEDKPDPAKSPVIMKDEKPPLPPPDYHRGSSRGGSPSNSLSHTPLMTGGSARGPRRTAPPEPQHRYNEMTQEPLMENTPPYQPPPPLTASRDSRLSRPKHTPNYRLPPPYVPP